MTREPFDGNTLPAGRNYVDDKVCERISKLLTYAFNGDIKKMSHKTFISVNRIKELMTSGEYPDYNEIADLAQHTNINIGWLLIGRGVMFETHSESKSESRPPQGVPYYADLPVSAGRLDVITADARPSGYVEIPGLHATALFPVVGCSMKPDINPGDVIGIVPLESWDRPDPDKVYLIITADDRMIKHLEADDADPDVLWCVSPNYRRFSIRKADIRFIYRVSYVGRLL